MNCPFKEKCQRPKGSCETCDPFTMEVDLRVAQENAIVFTNRWGNRPGENPPLDEIWAAHEAFKALKRANHEVAMHLGLLN